jgi:hypothetical protein
VRVEHLDPALLRALRARVAEARRTASDAMPEERRDADDPAYWQELFERNAAAVMAALPRVHLAPGHAVSYRFYGRRDGDLLVRPFITRAGSDLSAIRRLLDWHAPPDATAPSGGAAQDAELLYRFLSHEDSAAGVFEYFLAVQELWASQRWIHSTVLADAAEFAQLTAGDDWRVDRPVERVEPAVVRGGGDHGADLAVLVHSPLGRHAVTFHRVRIAADRSLEFAESLLVASGPRGLLV